MNHFCINLDALEVNFLVEPLIVTVQQYWRVPHGREPQSRNVHLEGGGGKHYIETISWNRLVC